MKTCRECKLGVDQVIFPKHPGFKDGLDSICKKCKSEKERNRYIENRETILAKQRDRIRNGDGKKYDLKRKFGITLEQYHDMVILQNGVCAICKKVDEDIKLSVDHCHTTGKIRGLLCRRCNMALGLFGDDTQRMKSAIEYLGEASQLEMAPDC